MNNQQTPTREQVEAVSAAVEAIARCPILSAQSGDPSEITYDIGVLGSRIRAARSAVLALFPQPTPSAEPERTYTAADVQEAFERGCVRGEQDANERNWSRRQYEKMHASLPPAEPVSIADMAPGTRCREEVSGTVPSWAGEDQISPCLCVLNLGHDGRHQCSHQVDPSTIRDVTPPKGVQ